MALIPLPIDPWLPQLQKLLVEHTRLVLEAAPGAGKTTRVPPALLDAAWLAGQRILVLEPRRLAARAAARRMAQERGESAGQTIGYRTRLDTRVGPDTRIEVITEGVLTRMLQQDPSLDGVGAVLFDEFHERSLQGDMGLAFCLESQQALRADLRLLVMSATLDGLAVAQYLGNAPSLVCAGRSYPVQIAYVPCEERADRTPIAAVVRVVHRALAAHAGDILVFLPGAGEIRRVLEQLQGSVCDGNIQLHALYGNLEAAEQDRAIVPAPAGQRKVVLATSIAQTSLTIEGIQVVVDAGRMRLPRFDPGSGMTRLCTQRVSRAAAEQRSGRAGRLGPGVCYRLWDEGQQAGLLAQTAAEILQADLTPLALELARWGTPDPGKLAWIDAPPAAAFSQARSLLQQLEALDEQGRITPHGEQLAQLPLHPRLAHMVLRGAALGLGRLACELAALLNERDIFLPGANGVDVAQRVRSVRRKEKGARVDEAVRQRVLRAVKQLTGLLTPGCAKAAQADDAEHCGFLLALAYPDRIAQCRASGQGRYRLRSGRAAVLDPSDTLWGEDYLVLVSLDGERREARIFQAAILRLDDLHQLFGKQLHRRQRIEWDRAAQRVVALEQQCLDALVMEEKTIAKPDRERLAAALLEGVRERGLLALSWSATARQLQARLAFLRREDKTTCWPDLSDAALLVNLETWLLPHLHGLSGRDALSRLDSHALLLAQLDWPQRQRLEEWAPQRIRVPSGSLLPIDYIAGDTPVLAVRLQEMFGCTATPCLVAGRVPLLLHLLSPARRPVQVTRDLASFWNNTYREVKKDLRGKYPRHHWPDNPGQAEAVRGVRRK